MTRNEFLSNFVNISTEVIERDFDSLIADLKNFCWENSFYHMDYIYNKSDMEDKVLGYIIDDLSDGNICTLQGLYNYVDDYLHKYNNHDYFDMDGRIEPFDEDDFKDLVNLILEDCDKIETIWDIDEDECSIDEDIVSIMKGGMLYA